MRTALLMAGCASMTMLAAPAFAQGAQAGEDPLPTNTAPARSTSYTADFFAKFAPRTALDIVNRIPGFSLDQGNTDLRGFSGTAGNVLIDGQRPSSKSESLEQTLAKIPASRVDRVDVSGGDAFGAEYAGKSQVANVILKAGGGTAGNISLSAKRSFNGHVSPNASGSVQLTRGPSTFSLSAATGRNDIFEKGFDRLTDPDSGDLIEFRRKYNLIYDHDPYVAANWALDQGGNRSAHLNLRFEPSDFRLRQVNRVTPADAAERDDTLRQHYKSKEYEVGGDISRPLGGGAIKLVGLTNRETKTTFDQYLFRGLGGSPVLGGFRQDTESTLTESVAKLSWTKPGLLGFSFEAGAEVARNKLDYALDLFQLLQGGDEVRIDLPLEDATVSEIRGEGFVNAGRAITSNLRADFGMRYEVSRLKVRGDATADRSLKFWKPSLTLDWRPAGKWHFQAIARRTVAQLDFFDFVSAAELSNDRINGGNANLVPQRTWALRLVAERPILGTGKLRFEAGHDIVSMLQDRVLIFDDDGNGFDAPGNLGTGRRWFANANFEAPLDMVWKGLRFSGNATVQKTRVKDPIWDEQRRWSDYYPAWDWFLSVRRDSGKWAYGVSVSDRDAFFSFRTDTIDKFANGGPYAVGFVEYRVSPSTSLTFDVDNLLATFGSIDRKFYFPNRTDPAVDLDEFRKRNSRQQFKITLKHSFGG